MIGSPKPHLSQSACSRLSVAQSGQSSDFPWLCHPLVIYGRIGDLNLRNAGPFWEGGEEEEEERGTNMKNKRLNGEES